MPPHLRRPEFVPTATTRACYIADMSSLYLEFDQIIRRFSDKNVEYAVIGGLAVGLYGYIRATEDIDFLVHTKDMRIAGAILDRLGYRQKREPWRFKDTQLVLQRFVKLADAPDEISVVDLLEADTPENLNMIANAIQVKFSDILIRVLSASDLVEMKRARNSDKDKLDIQYLEQRLGNAKP